MIAVSACLAGIPCRYDGKAKECADIKALVEQGRAITICPECLAGLPIPRTPAQIVGGDGEAVLNGTAHVLDANGIDVTAEFLCGAKAALEIAVRHGVSRAILKADSPSCGCGRIYDGSFSGEKCPGDGVTTALFKRNGIPVESCKQDGTY